MKLKKLWSVGGARRMRPPDPSLHTSVGTAKSPFTSRDSDASAMSLQHRSQMGCKGVTVQNKMRGIDFAATSQSLDVNGP